MKTREGSAPDYLRAGNRGDRPRTEEFDAAGDDGQDDARPRTIRNPLQTAEIDVARDRRVTMTSPIPAIMAESMVRERVKTPFRDSAVPEAARAEHTRRVGDSNPVTSSPGPTAKADVAPWRQRAAQRIDEARAAMEGGDLAAAVAAADAALREADEAPAPGIVEVIEPARPLLIQVFEAYVGPSSGLPVLAPKADDIARRQLGERERAVLKRIDGARTLEELFDGSGLGSTDALRVVARLIRSGAVRIV